MPINLSSSKEACIRLYCYKGLQLCRVVYSVAHSCTWEWMGDWNIFNTSKQSDNPRNKHSHFIQVVCLHCCTFWSIFLGLDQKLYSPIKHISLPSIRPLLAWNMISFSQRQSLTVFFSKLLSILYTAYQYLASILWHAWMKAHIITNPEKLVRSKFRVSLP